MGSKFGGCVGDSAGANVGSYPLWSTKLAVRFSCQGSNPNASILSVHDGILEAGFNRSNQSISGPFELIHEWLKQDLERFFECDCILCTYESTGE